MDVGVTEKPVTRSFAPAVTARAENILSFLLP